MHCTICNSKNTLLLDTPFQVYGCRDCRHEWSALPPPKQETYHPEYFREKHRKWFEYPNISLFKRIHEATERYTIGKDTFSFLDIGCGQGDLLRYLKEKGSRAKLFGIDLVQNKDDGITYYQGDFTRLPFTQKFDVVSGLMVIEHIGDPHEFMRKTTSVLKPGGFVIMNTINSGGFLYTLARFLRTVGFRAPFERLYDKHHLEHYNTSSLRKLFELEGYSIMNHRVHNFPLNALDVPEGSKMLAFFYRTCIACAFLLTARVGGVHQTLICRKSKIGSSMQAKLKAFIHTYPGALFLIGVLLFVNFYSFSTLTTKPAYWYDEAMNVELARNFADFGKLDLIVAPNTFSGQGALVGSTGYPITVSLAGFFKIFGFGLPQARIFMLLWISTLLAVFFYIAKELWGTRVAYAGTLLIATFAPFYGNGRSVMGEIPGFLFFLCAFYFLEQKKWWQSGLLLGLAVISKPSIFVFLIPAFALIVLCENETWKNKLIQLIKLGGSSTLALLPFFAIYFDEIARGGLFQNILLHFKNPYEEAGLSALTNIVNNLPTLITSTTFWYLWVMLAVIIFALFIERTLFREHSHLFILAGVYLPLSLFQYLKSLGYLRYLIAAEFLIFILFLITLPALTKFFAEKSKFSWKAPHITAAVIVVTVIMQVIHLFTYANLYSSTKAQETILRVYASSLPSTVGIINVPQVASFIPAFQKYQYLSTYGLSEFGTRMLYLAPEKLPGVIITASGDSELSPEERAILARSYDEDMAFTDGFSIYRKK